MQHEHKICVVADSQGIAPGLVELLYLVSAHFPLACYENKQKIESLGMDSNKFTLVSRVPLVQANTQREGRGNARGVAGGVGGGGIP